MAQSDLQREARRRKAHLLTYYPLGDGRLVHADANPDEDRIDRMSLSDARFGGQTVGEAAKEVKSKFKSKGGKPTQGSATRDEMTKAERESSESTLGLRRRR
jgi:hypothetical protein